ncbi:MAG TPA: hypothetical protein VMA13_01130 [Candidatus Saccharimonadales bacterium]|nr:hypothetical protein [Candidatus Saccharimonadales bacterium]
MEQANLVARKQRKEMFKQKGKAGKNTFALFFSAQLAHRMFAENHYVSRHEPLACVWKIIFGNPTLEEDKGKLIIIAGLVRPRFGWLQADQPQFKMVIPKHNLCHGQFIVIVFALPTCSLTNGFVPGRQRSNYSSLI